MREKEIARSTVAALDSGHYEAPSGQVVDIAPLMRQCVVDTRCYTPDQLANLRTEVFRRPAIAPRTEFEVVNETTLEGCARLAGTCQRLGVLNFASAKNPGGGFLNGSQAQEESLARSSALYASLLQGRAFYERHRASSSLLYSDSMIWSPDCPVFRDDEGRLLDEPHLVSFITSPAPNAGAIAYNRPEELPRIPEAFRRRSEYVLALAASQGYRQLVLGAWGCGVFRNDPAVVAEAFMGHLGEGAWAGRFERVVFSVFDTSPSRETLAAFERAVG